MFELNSRKLSVSITALSLLVTVVLPPLRVSAQKPPRPPSGQHQPLSGEWTDEEGRVYSLTQQADKQVTLRTQTGEEFKGSIEGNKIKLTHKLNERTVGKKSSAGEPFTKELQAKLVGQEVSIQGTISPDGDTIDATYIDFDIEADPQTQAITKRTERRERLYLTFRIVMSKAQTFRASFVVKSYIAKIGKNVGQIDRGPALVDLLSLAVATDAKFSENPLSDKKGRERPPLIEAHTKDYRLYSRWNVSFTCEGDKIGFISNPDVLVSDKESDLSDLLAPGLDSDTGQEGPLQPGPGIFWDKKLNITHSTIQFSWAFKGEPHWLANLALAAAEPSNSRPTWIWHRVSGKVSCGEGGPNYEASISGSGFPSHRLFINGKEKQSVPQGPFSNLWVRSADDPSRVK